MYTPIKSLLSLTLSLICLLITLKLKHSHDSKIQIQHKDKKLYQETIFALEYMTNKETTIYFSKLYKNDFKSFYKNGIVLSDNTFIYPALNHELTQYELIHLIPQIKNKNLDKITIIYYKINDKILQFAKNLKTIKVVFLHTDNLFLEIKKQNLYPKSQIETNNNTTKFKPKFLSGKLAIKYFYTGLSIYLISLFTRIYTTLYTIVTIICFFLCIFSLLFDDKSKNTQNV